MQIHGKEIDSEILFLNLFEFENENGKRLFTEFLQDLRDAVEVSTHTAFDFSYKPEDIHSFYVYITRNKAQMTAGHTFISKFMLDKLVDMIFACNPVQLDKWREVLFTIYRHSTKVDFLETDCSFMKELIIKINNNLSERKMDMDRIVLFQVNLLVKNLQTFIDQLS